MSCRYTGFSETQKTSSQENVSNCVQTLSGCSANIRVSVSTGGGASALCVERGYKKGEEGKNARHD